MSHRKKIVYGVLIATVLALTVGAQIAGRNDRQLRAGDAFPATHIKNIHGAAVAIPDAGARWVHLQFRRFAGCPICNLHLHSFVTRYPELEAAGIHEVVVFHSPNSSLLPFQGSFPFDVIGDPDKHLYRQFGVESSIYSILNPAAWPAMWEGHSLKDKPTGDPEGGPLGLPADLLIGPDGRVAASHYGKHAYDQWSVDELIALTKTARSTS
jgi:peroxiredoxin